MKCMKLGACVAALSLMAATAAQAQARRTNCASAAEISAVQVSAVQQELTDAALACGPVAVANFNRFQTVFGKELRASDALMLRKLPGVFCAGEMLDWEAPTGGYLLTACWASGHVAGQGVLGFLRH